MQDSEHEHMHNLPYYRAKTNHRKYLVCKEHVRLLKEEWQECNHSHEASQKQHNRDAEITSLGLPTIMDLDTFLRSYDVLLPLRVDLDYTLDLCRMTL